MITDPYFPMLSAALDPDAVAQALQESLSECNNGTEIRGVRVHRVHYKPNRDCRILYKIALGQGLQAAHHWFAGRLFGNESGRHWIKRHGIQQLAERYRNLLDQDTILKTYAFYVPPLQMAIQVYPVDRKLPWLIQAVNVEEVGRFLPSVLGRRIEGLKMELLDYEPGRKVTLKYTFHPPDAGRSSFQHVVAKSYGRNTRDSSLSHTILSALHEAAGANGFLAPSLGCVREFNMHLAAWLPGRPLRSLIRAPHFIGHIAAAAKALACLHDLPLHLSSIPRRTTRDEAKAVQRYAPILEALCPQDAFLIRDLSDRLVRILEDLTTPFTITHGDFHLDNVIVDDDVAVLDLEAVCLSDSLRDVGNFLERLPARATKAREVFLAEYLTARAGSTQRILVYQASSTFKKAVIPFKEQHPGWQERISSRLGRVEQILQRVERHSDDFWCTQEAEEL